MSSRDRQPRIASNRNPITVALAVALIALTVTVSVLLACSSPSTPAAPTAGPDLSGMPQADSAPDVATSVPNSTVTPFVAAPQPSRPEPTPSPIPTATPTPTPTATASPTPTAIPTATPTPVPPIYVATGLTAESVSAADGEVQMQMTVSIENIGGPIAEKTLEVNVDYAADGVEDSLTLNIPAADEIAHEFSVSVLPGKVRFNVEIHGELFPFDRVGEAADLEIVDTDWEAVSDGRIAVDVTLRNSGNAEAAAIIVVGSVTDSDGTVTEGEGQTSLIPIGEERTVQVLLNVPAGEHEVRLQATTFSLEADLDDNEGFIEADVTYVDVVYDYMFDPGGYWSDGSANVEVSVSAYNRGVGAFSDTAEMSYSCAGAGIGDDVSTGKFEFTMPDGFSAVTESITLRSSPGTLECRFISQEQGTETHEFNVPAKIVGVSREVWECYSDDTINRHGDIGCTARVDERVVKWDIDRPLKVWATGDPDYIDVLWATLDRLSPLLDMTFTNTLSQDEADLKAWVGITRDEGPERWKKGECADAAGCASVEWAGDHSVTGGTIAVWQAESEWILRAGLVDHRIEHVTLHELIHALVPMDHRDDPLSVVNIINAPDWIELDPLEEALIRLHRNPSIRPGMTTDEVRRVIVLEDEALDYASTRETVLTPIQMLREAFRRLQNADSASWRVEGGWSDDCSEFRFGRADYTIAGFYGLGANLIRFFGGSDEILAFFDDDWSREDGVWVKDPPDIWEESDWWPGWSDLHVLLVSALYYAPNDDIRVESTVLGETTLRFTLNKTTLPKADWYQSVRLEGHVTINDRTLEITAYEMDWHFNAIGNDSCDRYEVRASQGEYGVRIEVPDTVYFGTTDEMREAIDRVNGPR